jgi:hypothetical protein
MVPPRVSGLDLSDRGWRFLSRYDTQVGEYVGMTDFRFTNAAFVCRLHTHPRHADRFRREDRPRRRCPGCLGSAPSLPAADRRAG